MSNSAKIIKTPTGQDASNAAANTSEATLLSSCLGIVDITPIQTQVPLDSSLLKPYDLIPVLPSVQMDDLNLDTYHIKTGLVNVPTINGYAVIRILPITEDNLKTVQEKNEEAARLMMSQASQVFADQLEQNSGDLNTAAQSIANSTTTTTTTPIQSSSVVQDYTIDNPVYLTGVCSIYNG